MKLLIRFSFLGTNYCGYQVQPNGETIQSKLNNATEELFGYPCDIVGCSRTDSGVHAYCFCATIAKKNMDELPTDIPSDKIPQALSAHLPDDIRVYNAEWVPTDFHARYEVKEKEYLYRIYNGRVMSPFEINRAFHLPQELNDNAVKMMKVAASFFLGEHDFSAFMARGSKITDPVRIVTNADVTKQGNLIIFSVSSNGFLYHMVRIMAGTLIDVGLGRINPDEITGIIEKKDRSLAGFTAPACGLYLNRVEY